MLNVYIGYDQKEHIAANVCKFSIESRSSNTHVSFLKKSDIEVYTRAPEPDQSTEFTYTRFLVPFLCNYQGWSVFCDCDFLFLVPIEELLQCVDTTKAVSVVQHPNYVPRTQKKMNGIEQKPMHRKNWASLMVFNNSHPTLQKLTPDFINNVHPGGMLHRFEWIDDQHIGQLPLDWNCLDDYYLLANPKAIHYTDGGPWFNNYQNTMYSHLWKNEYTQYCVQALRTVM